MKKILLGMVIITFSATVIAADIGRGEQLSQQCVACHGADGNSVNPVWPKIAGQHASYSLQQMQLFKKGQQGGRYDPSMTTMMAGLSTQDMTDLAAFYASKVTAPGKADKALVERGQAIYRGGDSNRGVSACIACHGPAGSGNGQAKFPKLAGQHAQYTVKQLQDYRNETRSTDFHAIMRNITDHMSEKDMLAVASYVQGLH